MYLDVLGFIQLAPILVMVRFEVYATKALSTFTRFGARRAFSPGEFHSEGFTNLFSRG